MADNEKNGQAKEIGDCLNDDVQTALKNFYGGDSQFNRRTLVRTIFAQLEASIFALKQSILSPNYVSRYRSPWELS